MNRQKNRSLSVAFSGKESQQHKMFIGCKSFNPSHFISTCKQISKIKLNAFIPWMLTSYYSPIAMTRSAWGPPDLIESSRMSSHRMSSILAKVFYFVYKHPGGCHNKFTSWSNIIRYTLCRYTTINQFFRNCLIN
jgi:hypothetical protein